ncbi:MAG: TIGR02444 family protein [Burkholderiales bacterium]
MDTDAAWNAITSLYADPAVARDLLRRQDEEGLDVTLHLFALWAGTQGVPLDAGDLADSDAEVAAWRAQVVQPLRALRRAIKAMGKNTPASHDIEAVRTLVQAAELAAERVQVGMLCTWLQTR